MFFEIFLTNIYLSLYGQYYEKKREDSPLGHLGEKVALSATVRRKLLFLHIVTEAACFLPGSQSGMTNGALLKICRTNGLTNYGCQAK